MSRFILSVQTSAYFQFQVSQTILKTRLIKEEDVVAPSALSQHKLLVSASFGTAVVKPINRNEVVDGLAVSNFETFSSNSAYEHSPETIYVGARQKQGLTRTSVTEIQQGSGGPLESCSRTSTRRPCICLVRFQRKRMASSAG